MPPGGGELQLVVAEDEFDQPNGLCFSPDESLLYVNDSSQRYVKVFDVAPDGSLRNGRLFAEGIGTGHAHATGNVDGMECDEHGNVWVTGPGGVWVLTPDGEHARHRGDARGLRQHRLGRRGPALAVPDDLDDRPRRAHARRAGAAAAVRVSGELPRYGVGILGAGWVAAKYLDAFRDNPQTEIAGIYSPTPGKASNLAAAHRVAAREYASEDELFGDDRVDIIVSATPPSVRPEHVIRAAESGRHIVIEKPLATSPEAVESMRVAVERARVKTVTSFVLRWNSQLQTIRQLVDDGALGELLYAEADYWHPLPGFYYDSWLFSKKEGCSAFVGAGCHAADALRWLGGEVVEVAAFSAGPRVLQTLEYDPIVTASVRFANGAVGKLSTLQEGETPHIFNLRLFGSEGTIQNDQVFSPTRFPAASGYVTVPSVPPDRPEGQHPFAQEIAHFVACLDAGVESHASIHDTWRSMALCFAIDESVAGGGTLVKLPA